MRFYDDGFAPKLLAQYGLSVDPPKPDSFFWRAWNDNLATADACLNSSYIRGIRDGNLDPNIYGASMNTDSFYCYSAVQSIDIARQRSTVSALTDLLADRVRSYNSYNETFLKFWHIPNSASIVPTAAIQNYAAHEQQVAISQDPIYTLVAILPCYYLWNWLSAKLSGYVTNNLYGFWIEGNSSTKSAFTVGNFIEAWKGMPGTTFNEPAAMSIYKKSMNFELANFQSFTAVPTDILFKK